ncbi:folate-binding protein YgfZ [Methylocella silvestris BL2]|uniref:Folate-binding protein YgfZ n=1 Tax=Methylocella silvestris (strain DSM 15510 / CIP 108128 / LMG 27833 / NCIMB 13906 / BL2) TaxID=395965 RepID=B8END8_METSB|nr:folate-binding protein YgfZ [Methylocella silvestris]ACK50069.1 folate-binding protein YgfZ [Methylocella silvestris BL2]
MESRLSFLADRGVVRVLGAEAEKFLQRLITNSVLAIAPGESRFSALLSPQGKLMFDFFVVPLPEGPEAGYYFDCVRAQAPDLVKRLNLHKMRAKISIEDLSETLGVAALIAGEAPSGIGALVYRDMRAPGMGERVIASREALERISDSDESAYEARRIAAGVPRGGRDFVYGDAFVQDVNLDWLNGVDFKKGCYVGQEVVARVHYRKSAKKRIVKFSFEGEPPAPGVEIAAGGPPLGQVGSISGSEGLAMIRLDRLEDAKAAGAVVKAGETPIAVAAPE